VHRLVCVFVLAVAAAAIVLACGAEEAAGQFTRARLDLAGHIQNVGLTPNLLAPGAQPGTFVIGDLDGGWISLRRAADGGLLQNIYVGKSTLGLSAAPLGRELYAANVRGSTVSILDLRSGGLVDSLVVGQSANLVAASADGRFVIATAFEPGLVSAFDREFDFTRRTLVLDDRPAGLAVTRNRFPPRAYVVGLDRGKIFTLEFNPSNFAVVDTIRTREGASFIALSPDESIAYVSGGENRVLAVNLEQGFVQREIPVGGEPLGLDVSPNGRYVLVANSASGSVSLIETNRNIVVDDLNVGHQPSDVLFVSDTRAYVALLGDNALAVVNLVQ
jgi:YVTN family beta-propeller protein